MQANRPSNNGDILPWKLRQPVTAGEQLGCFAPWKTRRKAFVITNKMTGSFQVCHFKFYSPLWYIFDHSGIPCGALGTHFPGVRPSSTVTVPQSACPGEHTCCTVACARGCRLFSQQRWRISRGQVSWNETRQLNCFLVLFLVCGIDAPIWNDFVLVTIEGFAANIRILWFDVCFFSRV